MYVTDNHHVDDEDEAATFINENIDNTRAFIMDVEGTTGAPFINCMLLTKYRR